MIRFVTSIVSCNRLLASLTLSAVLFAIATPDVFAQVRKNAKPRGAALSSKSKSKPKATESDDTKATESDDPKSKSGSFVQQAAKDADIKPLTPPPAGADTNPLAANPLAGSPASTEDNPLGVPALQHRFTQTGPRWQAMTAKIDGHVGVAFDTLSRFNFDEEGDDKQIPKDVIELNKKKVAIIGYMIPLEFEGGKTNEFILLNMIPACCFGRTPRVVDWIHVHTKGGKHVMYTDIDAVVVTGTMAVGAEKEDGWTKSIYRVLADDVKIYKYDKGPKTEAKPAVIVD